MNRETQPVTRRRVATAIQLVAMILCTAIGARRGFQLSDDYVAGALIGGFVGLLIGLVGSGVLLTVGQLIRNVPVQRIRGCVSSLISSNERSEK